MISIFHQHRTAIALIALLVASTSYAQSTNATQLAQAIEFRAQMAAAVASGIELPAAAIERLKTESVPTGLRIPREAEIGSVALDVGRRLLATDKPEAAEEFFRSAEASFVQALKQNSARTSEQVQYLLKLALLRSRYLNNATQAKIDLEQARALRPDDPRVKAATAALASAHGQLFKNQRPQR